MLQQANNLVCKVFSEKENIGKEADSVIQRLYLGFHQGRRCSHEEELGAEFVSFWKECTLVMYLDFIPVE